MAGQRAIIDATSPTPSQQSAISCAWSNLSLCPCHGLRRAIVSRKPAVVWSSTTVFLSWVLSFNPRTILSKASVLCSRWGLKAEVLITSLWFLCGYEVLSSLLLWDTLGVESFGRFCGTGTKVLSSIAAWQAFFLWITLRSSVFVLRDIFLVLAEKCVSHRDCEMEGLNAVPAWDPPLQSQSTWEDMLNELLQDPGTQAAGAPQTVDEEVVGLVDGNFEDLLGSGEGPGSGVWWSSSVPGDPVLDKVDFSDLDDIFIVEESVTLPGLSSEVSSPGGDVSFPNVPKASLDTHEGSQEVGVSSPGSCSRFEHDRAPSSNSGDEVGNVSSRSHSPVLTSSSDQGAGSPDAGYDSSNVGAMGRSCDNFVEQSERRGREINGEIDEDAKRQSRLMRNRESATQSRLRKKSYIKELEAKCRAMESQMSMLHQTVAVTSAQNSALREELAHHRRLKGNGSQSGAMEPAALPSDSLPSESPSRHTTPFLSVNLELVAFLCHVLLLTLLLAPPQKPATSGEKAPSKARAERRNTSLATTWIERHSKVAKHLRKRRCSSNRVRKRIVLCKDFNSLRSVKGMFSATLKPGDILVENSSLENSCKLSVRCRLKRVSRRSQYSSVA